MKQKFLKQIAFLKKTLKWVKSHKKISLVAFIIFAIIIYFIFPKNNKVIQTEIAQISDVTKIVSVTGKVSADNSVNLSFQSSEILAYLGVNEGDTVKQGQLIASLDQSKLQASFRQAQQDFTAAKAASERYYSGHTNATESYDEKVSRTALDAAQNKAYDQMVKVEYDLNHSSLYAPFDGIVTRIDAKQVGAFVNATSVFTVTDPSSLSFKMEVDETEIGKVKENQLVNLSLDAFPNETLNLKIDKIDFVSHLTTSGGDTYYVTAKLNDVKNYRVGMNGNADIIVASKKNVLSIQSSDIFDDNFVYLKKGNKFEKRKVKLGLESDIKVEIVSGLNPGDVVAIDPNNIPENLILK